MSLAAGMKAGCDSILVTHLPNVRYLTGFSGSSGCVLVTRRKKAFFTDSRYGVQASRQIKGYEIVVANVASLRAACGYIVSRRLKTGVLGYEGAHLTSRQLGYLRRSLKGISLKDASGCVEDQRQRKDKREIAKLRRAARIADLAFESLGRSRIVGRREKEVAWMLEAAMREAGSDKLPFEIIVASGPRSAMPHGVAGNRVIRKNELVVIDLGASVGGYCSDATRTFSTGPLSGRRSEIYGVVAEAQELAIKAVRPGASCAGVDAVAREHIEAAGYGDAFGHSLGHGVGLEAHELPVLSSRSKDILEEGMVLTVEPGIYVERMGGVRIEDTVLVGRKGPVRLTKYPRKLVQLL